MGRVAAVKMKWLSKLTEVILNKRYLAGYFGKTAFMRWLLKLQLKKHSKQREIVFQHHQPKEV